MQQDKKVGVKDVDETAIIFCVLFCFCFRFVFFFLLFSKAIEKKKMEILNKFVALVWE